MMFAPLTAERMKHHAQQKKLKPGAELEANAPAGQSMPLHLDNLRRATADIGHSSSEKPSTLAVKASHEEMPLLVVNAPKRL